MENLVVFMISLISYIGVLLAILITISRTIRAFIEKRKIKNSILLAERGYNVFTSDNRGVPMLLIKGNKVVTSWKGETL